MTIKEVSALFNVSADTLRYYERVGMIPPVTRNASGIRVIRKLTFAGWSLPYVCEVLVSLWKFSLNM